MIAWMIYGLIAAAFITIAARAAESIARLSGASVRWCWAIAMALFAVLAAVAPLRQSKIAQNVAAPIGVTLSVDALPFQSSIDAVSRDLPAASIVIAATAWVIASGVLLFAVFGVHSRLRRVRHLWPLAEMHGSRVRVAPEVGPVVIGFRVPEIVVPRWLLTRTREEQRLIVRHEAEHVRAKDTVLLGVGMMMVAVMPWNPFVWYMFSRLRLAVELDCDARVLRGGTSVESYGSLLIDVASHVTPMRFGVVALANNTSHLQQRIIAMKPIVPKYARLRAGVIAVLGATALLAACEAKMPTAADVEAMDVGLVEARLRPLMDRGADSIGVYLVDHVQVSKEKAHTLKPDEIVAVRVAGGEGREPKKLLITTRDGAEKEKQVAAGEVRRTGSDTLVETRLKQSEAPVLLIDGVRSSVEAMKALDKSMIESVDVIKGEAVKELNISGLTDAELSRGLIRITTKRGP